VRVGRRQSSLAQLVNCADVKKGDDQNRLNLEIDELEQIAHGVVMPTTPNLAEQTRTMGKGSLSASWQPISAVAECQVLHRSQAGIAPLPGGPLRSLLRDARKARDGATVSCRSVKNKRR
jgi:hypothetical protein